jgi:hypothetical protein
MTHDEVVALVVAACKQALEDGTLSTYTPDESIATILGLDAFKNIEQPTQ